VLFNAEIVEWVDLYITAFMFMDLQESSDGDLPDEIKDKYTLTKTLGRFVLTHLY